MREFVIYYSRSNEVDDSMMDPLLQSFCESLPHRNVKLTKHNRGEAYEPGKVLGADLIIVGSGDLISNEPPIAKGCFTEIMSAHINNIPVITFTKGLEGYGDFVWLHEVGQQEVNLLDKDNWQLGHAELSLYDSYEGCDNACMALCCVLGNGFDTTAMLNNLLTTKNFDAIFAGEEFIVEDGVAFDPYTFAPVKSKESPDDNELLLLG